MSKYVTGREASTLLGVHQRTLYLWEKNGKIKTIRTPGNKRLYDVETFLKEKELINEHKLVFEELENNERLKIAYIRVSSIGQKDDLERQKMEILSHYPNHTLISDIGSGLNLNKRGIRKIISWAIEGRIEELVITYKDRLARFGYELIEDLINEYSKGKITVINEKKEILPEEELAYDVLQIMNVFVAKMNGLRKYKKNKHLDDIS